MLTANVNKMHSTDRIISLSPMEGKTAIAATGLVDNRLFNGENVLHAVQDTQTCLWHMKYDKGAVPAPLKQQFTSFNKLMTYAREYFKQRNIEIKEVID